MKEKMLKVKEYVVEHKKQIIIGAGVAVVAAVCGKYIIKKAKAVEIYDEDVTEEITGGIVTEIAE